MKRIATISAVAALLCSGCATVDLQSMAGSDGGSVMSQADDTNVVERAVERLKTAFASRGFGANASQRKMEAAADMLLNGLSARTVSDEASVYPGEGKPVSLILEDIEVAKGHVEQTRRAAEIYFEVAPPDRDLGDELDSLQAALLASERASRLFAQALPEGHEAELEPLRQSVDGLRRITDSFGDRVRRAHAAPVSAEATSVG
ncbi:MAG: hypothetical protein AAF311_18145 [Pseudomonadota bacterium]